MSVSKTLEAVIADGLTSDHQYVQLAITVTKLLMFLISDMIRRPAALERVHGVAHAHQRQIRQPLLDPCA